MLCETSPHLFFSRFEANTLLFMSSLKNPVFSVLNLKTLYNNENQVYQPDARETYV